MAARTQRRTFSRPLSVQEITKQAEEFDFFVERPIQAWLRSGTMLLRQAEMCEQDGDLQLAYLYLYRHAQLIIAKLPQHPDYKNPAFKASLADAGKAVQRNLVKLEQRKPKIQSDHERYVKAVERRHAETQRVQREREEDDQQRKSLDSQDGFSDGESPMLDASEHRELAVDQAQREIRRRDATRSTWQAGISPDTVAARRRGIIVGPSDFEEMIDSPVDTTSAGVRETGRLLRDAHIQDYDARHRGQDAHQSERVSYQYPAVPSRKDELDWRMPTLQPRATHLPLLQPPSVPAKTFATYPFTPEETPIPPPKPSLLPTPTSTSTPQRAPKYTFRSTASTESGVSLRTLLLPPTLRSTFLNLAHANTLLSLETCGILCGTLVSNALFITHLIIPDQRCTTDTCDTTADGDAALFDYCDAASLLVCGWIHTHPTQSCFLSSRDLHTSSGYQVMLPEAIAIVCAPRQSPDWGIFRLTDPPGLQAVLGCRQSGLFHPHDETNLYTDALRPGHVIEGPGLKFEVVDLRAA